MVAKLSLAGKCIPKPSLGTRKNNINLLMLGNYMNDENIPEYYQSEIAKASKTTKRRAFEKFVSAALGSIPWVGGFITAAITLKAEQGSIRKIIFRTNGLKNTNLK